MTRHLHGFNDIGGEQLHGDRPGWTLINEQVGLNTSHSGSNYDAISSRGIGVVVRMNHAYGSGGTIPLPTHYQEYAQACASFARNSSPVDYFIVANEPNLERPNGVVITPAEYARCFVMTYEAVKKVKSAAKIVPAALAPYNASPIPWIDFMAEMLELIAGTTGCDAVNFHAYTRSMNPQDIYSNATMNDPLEGLYYGFKTCEDALLKGTPSALRHLPAMNTEFDVYDAWENRNTGVITEHYKYFNTRNAVNGNQKVIMSLCFRWLTEPDVINEKDWGMRNKPQLLEDFRTAVAKGYKLSETTTPTIPSGPTAVVNVASGAKIRIGPGTSYSSLGAVVNGTSLPITGRSSDSSWLQVSSEFGKGWVSSSIIRLENPQRTTIPVVTVTIPIPVTPPSTPPSTSPSQSLNKDWLIKSWCRVLGIDETLARATLAIESSGRAFENGRMIIRFENHIFHLKIRQLAPKLEGKFHVSFKYGSPSYTGHEWRSNEVSPWREVHTGSQENEWTVFKFASILHEAAAMQSISMGAAQIMGFNYADVGYPNAQAMFHDYNDPSLGEFNQLTGFFAYIVNKKGLLEAARQKDFATIALLYNGEGQTEHYASLLRNKYRELGGG